MISTDIRIVLVEPSHPGNIGAVARAMKNMALDQLVLVKPKQFPHAEAVARASGADDVLANARVVDSVREALAGCGFVAATTSRDRDQYFRVADVRDAAERLVVESRRSPAAVLFGAERTGLTNEDLEAAHVLIRIPANEAYLSLNLAMAVQLVTYEIFRARGVKIDTAPGAAPMAAPEDMERMYVHLAQVMEEIDFRDRTQSGTNLMGRIRRFMQRAELDKNEVNILRGILTAVQNRRRHAGGERAKISLVTAIGGASELKGRVAGKGDQVTVDRDSADGVSQPVYLDYAATTPVDPAVANAMFACLTEGGDFGNASSATHVFGQRAAARVETARAQVAALIGADPDEITFTSGGTESNNLAILGMARANSDRGRHVITARTEHKAVLDPCKRLEREGFISHVSNPRSSGSNRPGDDTCCASARYAARVDHVRE